MRTPSKENNSKKESIKQDLLSLIEDLEKKRRKLLVAIVRDFGSWGELINESRKIISEMKKKRFIRNTHEIED